MSSSSRLFRRQVIDARRQGWLGGISLVEPPSLRLLTFIAVGAVTLIVLFVLLGSYTQRATVTGQLVPTLGLATVQAPLTGVVDRLDVAEGQVVAAGDVLALIAVPRVTSAGDASAVLEDQLEHRRKSLASARSAQANLLDAQARGVAEQLAVARRELGQIQAEVATRASQVRIARQTLDRIHQLAEKKYVSQLQLHQQQATVLDYTGQMQALQRQASEAQRLVAQLEQTQRELPNQRQASDADYDQRQAQLRQEWVQTQAGAALVLKAPVAGVIATQVAKSGQAVQAGQPIVSILPADGRLEAELLVPSRSIGFITPGDKVLMRYQAYPYQKFGHQEGRVARISRSALSAAELGALGGAARSQGETLYRVTVSLAQQTILAYGKPELLKPGMLLDADVLGESRRLVEWILEPLYSVRGNLST